MSITHFANASSAKGGGVPPPLVISPDGIASTLDFGTPTVQVDAPSGPTTFVESVQDANPDYWWRLNESAGLVVADSGSLNNPLIYPIDAGTAGYDTGPSSAFTGAGARAKIIDADAEIVQGLANVAGDINPVTTLEFLWFPISNAGGVVFSKQLPGGAGAFWQMDINGTALRLRTFVGFGANIVLITDITPLIGQWNYLSIVYDKTTSNIVSIKVDDVAGLSPSIGSESIEVGATTTIAIGGQTAALDASDSRLDEVQFYNRILTDSERTRNYNFWATGVLGNTQAEAIAAPSQTLLQISTFSDTISAPAGSWICFEMSEGSQISQYLDSAQLTIGADCAFQVWQTVAAVDGLVASETSLTAPSSDSYGAHNPATTRLMFLVRNNTSVAQDVQIFIPD